MVGLKRRGKTKGERENIVFPVWFKIENREREVLTWPHKISSPRFGKEIKEKKAPNLKLGVYPSKCQSKPSESGSSKVVIVLHVDR